jgi:hypothetical protein
MPHNLCKRLTSPDPCKECRSRFQLVAWGRDRVRGMGYHAPTPQAGRVTDSDGGGRVREEVGVRSQAPPSLMDSLYQNTEEVTAID